MPSRTVEAQAAGAEESTAAREAGGHLPRGHTMPADSTRAPYAIAGRASARALAVRWMPRHGAGCIAMPTARTADKIGDIARCNGSGRRTAIVLVGQEDFVEVHRDASLRRRRSPAARCGRDRMASASSGKHFHQGHGDRLADLAVGKADRGGLFLGTVVDAKMIGTHGTDSFLRLGTSLSAAGVRMPRSRVQCTKPACGMRCRPCCCPLYRQEVSCGFDLFEGKYRFLPTDCSCDSGTDKPIFLKVRSLAGNLGDNATACAILPR